MPARALRVIALAMATAGLPSSAFAQCDPLVVRHDGSNWWYGAFGRCKQRGGTTDRAAILDCAFDQLPAPERLECLKTRLAATEQTRQAIDDVAAFNGPPNSCDQLMVKYDRWNWWWGAFGRCKQGGGTTDRNAIFNCAWNQVPASDSQTCLRDRLRDTEFTRQAIDDVAAANGPPGNCDQLMRKYDGWNWWAGTFDRCKGNSGATDRDAIFECAWIQVPAQESRPCLKERLRTTEQTRRGIDSVAAVNGVIANNRSTMRFDTCATPDGGCPETCELPSDGTVPNGYVLPETPGAREKALEAPIASFNEPPAHNIGGSEGRLNAELRSVARVADPLACSLPLAAMHFARGDATMGRAMADLSVTGRRAFAAFKQGLPDRMYCRRARVLRLSPTCPVQASPPTRSELSSGCGAALDRAYAVANYLRTGQALQANPNKAADRRALGWIAVSGEDDLPHRPVNVPSSDFPQYDIDVPVEAPLAQPPGVVTVPTRFVVAQSSPPPLPTVGPAGWTLRPEPPPVIQKNAKVLLFIHGMDSRAEEATDITRALFSRMAGSDRNLVVIAVDLPTSGYAATLDYDRVSPLIAMGAPKFSQLPVPIPLEPTLYGLVLVPVFVGLGLPPPPPIIPPGTPIPDFGATGQVPLLDFIETFVVRFVDTLDAQAPIKRRIQAVMGGSLGGNISFRLGRRPDVPWLPATVVWSPASIWDSLGEGPPLNEPWQILKHLGPRDAWQKAADRDPTDPNDLSPRRVPLRAQFFGSWDQPILRGVINVAQSDTWTSDRWPCKKSAVAGARLDRHETYDPRFQSWHWRLGAEQLLYSHQSGDSSLGVPRRYLANYKPMLLACGVEDEVPFNNICSATQKTAPFMTMTPGKAVFMDKTGHSLDNERPAKVAELIDEFLALK